MIGFHIKKAFFDGWDNLLSIVLQNLIYIGFLAMFLAFGILFGEEAPYPLFLAYSAFIILLCCLSAGGTASVALNWSNYEKDVWKPYIKGIRRNIKHSLFLFAYILFLFVLLTLVVPFYMGFSNILGFIVAMILVWLVIFTLLAVPFYFPLMNLLPGDGPFKTAKKSLIIVTDNLGSALYLLLHNIIDLIISIFTIGMIPGVSGMMLGAQDMMKILMKKYDWLEENPDKTRKDLDWYELLEEEKEAVGPRTLKGMIFPWK